MNYADLLYPIAALLALLYFTGCHYTPMGCDAMNPIAVHGERTADCTAANR
jgi:hypothetical protein